MSILIFCCRLVFHCIIWKLFLPRRVVVWWCIYEEYQPGFEMSLSSVRLPVIVELWPGASLNSTMRSKENTIFVKNHYINIDIELLKLNALDLSFPQQCQLWVISWMPWVYCSFSNVNCGLYKKKTSGLPRTRFSIAKGKAKWWSVLDKGKRPKELKISSSFYMQ